MFVFYFMLLLFMFVCAFADRWAGTGGNQRRQRLAQDYLVWMDQTGELLSLAERQEVDPVKQERMEVRGHHNATSVPVKCLLGQNACGALSELPACRLNLICSNLIWSN